jgi:hypothetical protein
VEPKRWQKTVNNMHKQNMPKRSTVKKRKTGQQPVSIESASANAVHLCMTLQTNSSDDADDNFHIQ